MAKIFICTCRGQTELPPRIDFGSGFDVITHPELCSEAGQELVKKESVGPLVIAACTPRIAERFFPGRNIELVNIREQGQFYGWSFDKIATSIRAGIEKLRWAKSEASNVQPVQHRSVLILGAGVTGLEAARLLGRAGVTVHLLEKESFVGGVVGKLDRLYPEGTPNSHTLYPLINEVVNDPRIKIYASGQLVKLAGRPGAYQATVTYRQSVDGCDLCRRCEATCPITVNDHGLERKAIYYQPTYPDTYQIDWNACNRCGACVKVCDRISLDPPATVEVEVGAVLNTSGLHFFDATRIKEYGYGRLPGVMNTIEFERRLVSGLLRPKKVVIIACAGSRDHKYLPYCSRVCCLIALKEAKLVKDIYPDTQVYVTYIDMRAYGTREKFYTTLRDVSGVTFIKGKPSEVRFDNGRPVVLVEDSMADEMLAIDADCVVLSTGFVPDEKLLELLGIKSEPERFPGAYTESSLAIDSNPRGIFFAGSAAFPVSVTEATIDARNTAASIISFLDRNSATPTGQTARINSDICAASHCRMCVGTCPYGAIYEEDEKIKVNEAICMGCGICSAACMAGASQLSSFSDVQLLAQIRALARPGSIIALLCKWSAYNAADKAGYERKAIPENVSIVRIPCTGRVESQMVLEALSHGAKGVLIGGCYPDACHYIQGNFKARNRCRNLQALLGQLGLPERVLKIDWFGKEESQKLFAAIEEMNK